MSRASTNMCSSVILSSKQCNSDGIDLIAQLVERQALELLGVGSNPPSVSVFVKRKWLKCRNCTNNSENEEKPQKNLVVFKVFQCIMLNTSALKKWFTTAALYFLPNCSQNVWSFIREKQNKKWQLQCLRLVPFWGHLLRLLTSNYWLHYKMQWDRILQNSILWWPSTPLGPLLNPPYTPFYPPLSTSPHPKLLPRACIQHLQEIHAVVKDSDGLWSKFTWIEHVSDFTFHHFHELWIPWMIIIPIFHDFEWKTSTFLSDFMWNR